MTMLLPLIVLGGMMFFMTRSQKKQQKQRQDLLNSIGVGSSVVTIGGLHGIVEEIDSEKNTVILNCEGILLEFNRAAISTVTASESVKPAPVVETVETTDEESN